MFRHIGKTSMLAAALLLTTGAAQAANIFVNGGFETAGTGSLAANWAAAGGAGYEQLCGGGVALSGNCVADITSPALSSGVALQNNVDDGGSPESVVISQVGQTLDLSFWAYGWAGTSGAANYALRFLNSGGGILAEASGNFNGSLAPTTDDPNDQTAAWTEVTTSLLVPVGATAAFLEFSHGMGPIGPVFPDCGLGNPNGLCFQPGLVYIDDVSLETVAAVPVPAAVWLFGSGLLGLVGVARRRKS